MRTSGICVRIRFRHSHGAVFIAATISAKNDLLHRISLRPGLTILLLSPKGIVLSIMGVRIVQAVLSNIPTWSARVLTKLANLMWLNLSTMTSVLHPPSPSLPNPVKFTRLLHLLPEYDHSDGFWVHFEGKQAPFQAKNLVSAYQNPELVDWLVLCIHHCNLPLEFLPWV